MSEWATTNISNPVKKRFYSMMQKMTQYVASWTDIKKYIVPTRGQFNNAQPTYGQMIDHKTLIDSHATNSNRILASGLNSGMTSKSRPWFRLTLDDQEKLKIPGVKEWLDMTQRAMYTVLNKSNLYGCFQSCYEELGSFATGAFCILEDFDSVVRGRSYTAGEYALATDAQGRVCGFARQFWMTVDQVVKEFGLESCSSQVQSKWKQNDIDAQVNIYHLIEPNDKREPDRIDFNNMPYRSVYWESTETTDKYLRRSGFRKFPVVAPRWDTSTTDMIYGFGPGWHCLGNVKQLQKTQFDKLLAQEKLHNPPMQQDASIEGHTDFLPGGVTKTNASVPDAGVRPAYQIDPKLESFIELINELKDAIDKDFFVNLFLMLINIDKTNMTATEVAERQQEKIMMMGPILHRLDEEMLSPTLEIVFDIMQEAGMIMPPPPGLQGEIKIDYISVLAQAQRALGSVQIERVLTYIAEAGQFNPDMIDVFDFDESLREVADNEGIPAKLIRDEEAVAQIRAQRQKMQMAAQASELANQAADTTKKLADSQMGTGSALDGLTQPYLAQQ